MRAGTGFSTATGQDTPRAGRPPGRFVRCARVGQSTVEVVDGEVVQVGVRARLDFGPVELRLGRSARGSGVGDVGGQVEVLEDAADGGGLGDEGDDFQFAVAARAGAVCLIKIRLLVKSETYAPLSASPRTDFPA